MSSTKKPLSPALIEKARVELNEIQGEVPEQIRILRDKIRSGQDRSNFRTDDAFLIRFLRTTRFNQEAAFQLVKDYYKLRQTYPKLYEKLSTSALTGMLSSNFHGVLAERDEHGRAIAFFNSLEYWDPQNITLEHVTANYLLSLETLVEDEEVQINGVIFLADINGLTLKHFPLFTPAAFAMFFANCMTSFPLRHEAVHFVNKFKLFDPVWFLMKPFLGKELRNKTVIHGSDMSKLHESITPKILPTERGGRAGSFDNARWCKVLKEHDESLKKDLKYGYVKK